MLLSIITPISKLAGHLTNLSSWLVDAVELGVEVVLVHDVNDAETSIELKDVIHSLKNRCLILLESKYGSPGAARNAGLEQSSGRWVMFWDGDDVGDIREVLTELSRPEVDQFEAIIFQYDIRKICVSSIGYTTAEQSITDNFTKVAVNPGLWRMCFQGRIARKFKFPEISMAEDQMFLTLLDLPNLRTYFSQRIVYHYYTGRIGQLTSNPDAIDDLFTTIKQLRSCILLNPDNFLVILLLRQSITALKRGRWGLKATGARSIFWLCCRYPKVTYQGLTDIRRHN